MALPPWHPGPDAACFCAPCSATPATVKLETIYSLQISTCSSSPASSCSHSLLDFAWISLEIVQPLPGLARGGRDTTPTFCCCSSSCCPDVPRLPTPAPRPAPPSGDALVGLSLVCGPIRGPGANLVALSSCPPSTEASQFFLHKFLISFLPASPQGHGTVRGASGKLVSFLVHCEQLPLLVAGRAGLLLKAEVGPLTQLAGGTVRCRPST